MHHAHPFLLWPQVLSDRLTTRHLKLINTTEILHYFRVLVSRPFFTSQGGASWDNRACHQQQCEEEMASSGPQLVLRPQENMLVSAGAYHLHPTPQATHTHVLLTSEHQVQMDSPRCTPQTCPFQHTESLCTGYTQMNLLHIATCIPETCPDLPVCVGQCTLVSIPASHHAPSLLMCQVLHTQQTCTGHGSHMLHPGALLSHVLVSGATLGSTSPINRGLNRIWLDRQATCLQQPGVTLCPHPLR